MATKENNKSKATAKPVRKSKKSRGSAMKVAGGMLAGAAGAIAGILLAQVKS